MEVVFLISLFCVFVFFLINHAPIFSFPRKKLFTYLDIQGGTKNWFGWICRQFRYMLGCIFCITFWITLTIDHKFMFFTPVVATIINHLFLNSFKHKF